MNYYVEIILLYLEDGMLIASNIHTTYRNEWYYFYALKSLLRLVTLIIVTIPFLVSCFVGAHFFRSFGNDTKLYDSIKFVLILIFSSIFILRLVSNFKPLLHRYLFSGNFFFFFFALTLPNRHFHVKFHCWTLECLHMCILSVGRFQ